MKLATEMFKRYKRCQQMLREEFVHTFKECWTF